MKRVQRERTWCHAPRATRLVPSRVVCGLAFLAARGRAGGRGVRLRRRRLQLARQRVRWPHRLPRAESQQLRQRALRVLLPRLAVRQHGGQRGRVQLLLRRVLRRLLRLHGGRARERRRRRGAHSLHARLARVGSEPVGVNGAHQA